MKQHSHEFVETYTGAGAFGFDRATDEESVIFYLQKFSDDRLMQHLVPQMTDQELEEIYFLINRLLKKYLSKYEYKSLFLKEENDDC
ncbi:MAG: cytoplasmic protein [Desulfosudaceae bacterium]